MAKSIPLSSMTPAARRKRIAVLAKNPGTRSSIPDKYLPAQFKAARATAQRVKTENATIYNPTAVLGGNDLRNAVKSEVDLNLNPQIAAYDKNIKDLGAARDIASSRLGGYFDLYNKQAATSAANLSNSGNALVQQLAAAGKQTQDTLGGVQADIDSRSASDAALRGSGLQDFGRANAAVDFNKAQAAGATQSAVGAAAGQVGGTNTLAGTIAAVAPMRAGDQQFALAGKFNQQIADMTSKRAATEATRGPLTTQTLDKMRQDQFTNLATMKGLDIKQADLQETARSHQANEALTNKAINQRNLASVRTASSAAERLKADKAYKAAQIQIKRGIDPVTGKKLPHGGKAQSGADALNRWKLKFAQSHGYLPSTGAGKGGSGGTPSLTPNERTKQIGKFASLQSTVQSGIQSQGGVSKYGRVKAAKDFLASKAGKGADPLYVSASLDMLYDGHVSRANAEKLHQRGLTVKDLGLTGYQEWARKHRGGKGASKKVPGIGPTIK